MVKGKKAFLRTLEAAIAIIVALTIILAFIPQFNTARERIRSQNALEPLTKDEQFRTCVLTENITCINTTLSTPLQNFHYTINISKNPHTEISGLPTKQILSESAYIAGNTTTYSPRIIRIFYWARN
ncbi:hypothetical protein HY640_01860 [Candidatus Woesearchaeota archaeon]|nr:hypothetical protein [Candidatus Woesearchaeota archaeon]